jgi:hypothetical protein
VTVSQSVLLLVAVHGQSAGVVTVIEPMPPPPGTGCADGAIDTVQPVS